VPLSELPPPDPDTYYAFQLVGLAVVDDAGRELGRVVEVHPGVANDNLELEEGMLVPLIDDAVRSIELDAGRIVVERGFLGL
jgi:16S rRNA processing protein RimM